MIIKRRSNGDYCVFHSDKNYNTRNKSCFLVRKASTGNAGKLNIGTITFPRELVGKRIRLKLERC